MVMDDDEGVANTQNTGNVPFIGPQSPLGEGGEENSTANFTELELSDYSDGDHDDAPADVEDHGSSWVNEDIARGIRARGLGLGNMMVERYNLEDIVPSTLGDKIPSPPKLHEPDQNSVVSIDPSSDTGQTLLGNCQRRKTIGQLLSGGKDTDGTTDSNEKVNERFENYLS